jgi:hypothetical protein
MISFEEWARTEPSQRATMWKERLSVIEPTYGGTTLGNTLINAAELLEDGPDCQTLVADVRQACLDHYLEGLDVDCHSFITSTNVAVMQSGGALFKNPSGKNPAVASRAGAVMCASTGKKLRAAIAAAAKTPPPPGCKALGRALDEPCFRKIGTPDYQGRCSGHLIATKKVPSDAMCSVQLTAAKGNGLVK